MMMLSEDVANEEEGSTKDDPANAGREQGLPSSARGISTTFLEASNSSTGEGGEGKHIIMGRESNSDQVDAQLSPEAALTMGTNGIPGDRKSEEDAENDSLEPGSHRSALDNEEMEASELTSYGGSGTGLDRSSRHGGGSIGVDSNEGSDENSGHSTGSDSGSGSIYSDSVENSNSSLPTTPPASRVSPGRGGPGRGSPGRGRGRGPGRGRGLAGLHDAQNQKSLIDIHDERSDAARRPMMPRAASERFHYKANPVGLPRPNLEKKAASLTQVKDDSEGSFRRVPSLNRSRRVGSIGSFAFGISREQAHYTPKVIRKSNRIDVQTGGETYREVICQRIIDYPTAMNPADRRRKLMVRKENAEMNASSVHRDYNDPQFRLQSKLHSSAIKEQMGAQIVHPGALTQYLIWSLRSNFLVVLLSEALAFWTLICVFAMCIYLGAYYQPECVRLPENGDTNFEEGGTYFIDAFALSWTTFSTVGYGLVHPQVNKEEGTESFHCSFMTTIVSLESFVGVLFASFCGAVIVGKISRAKSTASVRFSQRMVVRFGSGVMCTDDDDDRIDDSLEKPITNYEKRRTRFPCPVLEFRLSNALFDNANGEIMNSKLSVVCSTVLEKETVPSRLSATTESLIHTINPRQSIKVMANHASQFLRKSLTSSTDERSDDLGSGNQSSDDGTATGRDPKKQVRRVGRLNALQKVSLEGSKAIENVLLKKRLLRPRSSDGETFRKGKPKPHPTVVVDEDPTEGLVPKKAFTALDIECNTHPFLKRVWTIRHVLNADSPLLSAKAKKMIREKRGTWPREACNYDFIREHMKFQQLIVSLSGTTCVNGCDVYGLHVYDYSNLHVGYTFAPIANMVDSRLKIDLNSIDNIREQRGGQAEPINYYAETLAEYNQDDATEENTPNSETKTTSKMFATKSSTFRENGGTNADFSSGELREIMGEEKDVVMGLPNAKRINRYRASAVRKAD